MIDAAAVPFAIPNSLHYNGESFGFEVKPYAVRLQQNLQVAFERNGEYGHVELQFRSVPNANFPGIKVKSGVALFCFDLFLLLLWLGLQG